MRTAFPRSTHLTVRRGAGGLVGALVAAGIAFAPSVAATSSLVQLSSDPYTNTPSQHRTEVEPDTLSAGSTIVSAFQAGRFFGGGASNIGFATSTNGGSTWSSGFLPGTTPYSTPTGTWARVSDPSVAYDPSHGVWLISYLGLSPGGNTSEVDVLVSRSTNGTTWSNPVIVNNSGDFNDKNWTVCDTTSGSPFYGHCYTEFDDNSKLDLILTSTSTDGGSTWGAALPTTAHDHGIGGQPLVQPGGRVIVPIEEFAGRFGSIASYTSTDGGASWNNAVQVSLVSHHTVAGNLRSGILPSAEIDGAGKVYVTWSDCRFEPRCPANDLVFSTSTDGVTWTAVTRIPSDAIGSGVDHFIPGLAVDRSTAGGSAHLDVTFYYYPNAACTTSTCQLDVGTSSSSDGGASWTTNTQLAGPMTLTWLANTNQGYMVGDYISTSFSGGVAYPAFAVASAPKRGVFNEAIYTVRGGLTVATGVAATDQVPAGAKATNTSGTLRAQ